MKLYVDIYLAVNFTIDFFVLCLTAKILSLNSRILRLVLAAFVGAATSIIPILFPSALFSALNIILSPALMIYVTFGKMGIVQFFKTFTVLFGCSFAAGGIFSFIAENVSIMRSPKALFAASFAVFFFCFFFFDILSFSSDTDFVDIVITDKNKIKKLRLLCDSGCLVREPICGTPVILLSPKIFDNLYSPEEYESREGAVRLGKRLVPIKTANGSSIICAVKPEKLTYIHKNTEYPCKAMVGRSNSDSFAGVDGIFPKTLLK